MSILYVVSESDNDAVFYALCAEKLTGRTFSLSSMKNRKGDGVEAVKLQLKYAVKMVRNAARGGEQVSFIAAMDNDRAPHAENTAQPGATGTGLDRARLTLKERNRAARLAWMIITVESVLGINRAAWGFPIALAVPVEMLESWIVRARRPEQPQPMPHFSKADSDRARQYYRPTEPPPQWKDLIATEKGGEEMRDFLARVVRELDAEALAGRSPSFRMFKDWLDAWPRASIAG